RISLAGAEGRRDRLSIEWSESIFLIAPHSQNIDVTVDWSCRSLASGDHVAALRSRLRTSRPGTAAANSAAMDLVQRYERRRRRDKRHGSLQAGAHILD